MEKIIAALIIILISISPLFRGLFFEYETYGFMAALALLCVLYFIIIIYKRETIHINRLYLIIGMLMLAGICFSFANAMNARATLRSLLFYMELMVIFIVLYDYFYGRNLQFMKAVMLPTVIVGAVAGFVGMVALTGKFNVWQVTALFNRVGSTFQYANTASVYFLICFICSITLANIFKNSYVRSIITGLGSISLFAFFMTGSRGGFVVGVLSGLALLSIQPSGMKPRILAGFACSAVSVFLVMGRFNSAVKAKDNFESAKSIVISFMIAVVSSYIINAIMKVTIENIQISFSKKTKYISALIAIFVLLIFITYWKEFIRFLPPVLAGRFERLFDTGLKNDVNIQSRFEYFSDAIKLLVSHWLFGLGGDGWKAMYHSVQDYEYIANYVHNHYLQIFVDHGILAFLSYIGLVVISTVSLLYSYLKARDRLFKSCTAGMLCGFVALAAHSAFDFDLTYGSMALLFWVMFAVSAAESSDETVQKTKTSILGVAFRDRWKDVITGSLGKLAFVTACALLLSMHALWFTAAYNAQKALDYKQDKNYMYAMLHYQEALRLDPSNSKYSFELAKIYHYFGRQAADDDVKEVWMKKARNAGEVSVNGNKNYPTYMGTLIRIYLDSGMPLEAVDMAQKLVSCDKYDAGVYELLARSYIDAALYYEKIGDTAKARELLDKCITIDNDQNLQKSVIEKASEINSPEVIARYNHSDKLAGYLKDAEELLLKLRK